jgi:hypothetical protein
MLTKLRALKALWNDTPHVIQAGVLIFIGSATGAVTHYFTDSDPCFNWTCLRHLAGSALHGGVTAAVAFYLLPSNKAAILAEISKAAPEAETPKP